MPMASAQELIDVIASVYRDRPDDYVVSVGHWIDENVPDMRGGVVVLPRLVADIKLSAGELRALTTAGRGKFVHTDGCPCTDCT